MVWGRPHQYPQFDTQTITASTKIPVSSVPENLIHPKPGHPETLILLLLLSFLLLFLLSHLCTRRLKRHRTRSNLTEKYLKLKVVIHASSRGLRPPFWSSRLPCTSWTALDLARLPQPALHAPRDAQETKVIQSSQASVLAL